MDPSSADREPLEILADDFLARRRRGESPQLREYIEKYPDLADEIRDLFPTLQLMDDAAPGTIDFKAGSGSTVSDAGITRLERVGDYRILKEIGRGAMGVVYEAEQESLGRRVALKLLPRQLSTDERALGRFRREARAAARLHHTNIVPVFEVGQDGDTLYYAMQYIQGQSLDKVLAELRRMRTGNQREVADSVGNLEARTAALSLCRGRFGVVDSEPSNLGEAMEDHLAGAECVRLASADAHADDRSAPATDSRATKFAESLSGVQPQLPAYFRSVATIGEQAASALSYAHERDTVHRDIKPSNLLLDTNGVLWVADFGLAKFEDDGHTRTGDLVGTLRYMSPERFDGRCDARADVYSLGVTLYELLLLQPAFTSTNQLELMDHISNLEPRRPRAVDSHIPRDLETIVIKAMEKEPARRYQSAQDMADDLHRFLEDEPIQARKSSSAERFVRWARRNRAVAALTLTVMGLLTVLTVAATWGYATAMRGWQIAQIHEEEATDARDIAKQREAEAQDRRREAEVRLYMSDMNRVQQAYDDGNLGLVISLLTKYTPSLGKSDVRDLRGPEWYFWWRAAHQHQSVLFRGGVQLDRMVASPDGASVVVFTTGAKALYVLDISSHSTVSGVTLSTDSPIFGGAFVRAGTLFAALSSDGQMLFLWETARWTPQPAIALHTMWEPHAACSASSFAKSSGSTGREILGISTTGGQILLVDTQSWQKTCKLVAERAVGTLAISPDAAVVVASVEEVSAVPALGKPSAAQLVAWDVATGVLTTLDSVSANLSVLTFSPDGHWLATGSADRTVRLWDAKTLKLSSRLSAGGSVLCLAFSPDSRRLAAGTRSDNSVRVWDVTSASVLCEMKAHIRDVLALDFLDDNRLVTAGMDTSRWAGEGMGSVKLWEVEHLQDPCVIAGDFYRLAYSKRGDLLYAASSGGRIEVFDSRSGKAVARSIANEKARNVSFSTDGQWAATVDSNRALRIWNLADDRVAIERQLETLPSTGPLGMAISSQGTKVAWDEEVEGGRHRIALYDATTAKTRYLKGQGDLPRAAYTLAFSAEADLIVFCSQNSPPSVWALGSDAARPYVDRCSSQFFGEVVVCDFARCDWPAAALDNSNDPDLSMFAVGEHPASIKLLDIRTFRTVKTLEGHASRIICCAFSQDGKRLLTGAEDCTVRMWDTKSGELLSTFKGHSSSVVQVTIAPDGSSFASCGWDGKLYLRHTTMSQEYVDRDLGPELPELIAQGDFLARNGQWEEALRCYDRALVTLPDSPWWPWLRTTLILQLGNMPLYRQRCQELSDTYGNHYAFDPKPCLIAKDAVVNLVASARRAAEWVDASDATHPHLPWRLFTRSLAEYRCGKYRESIASLAKMREVQANLVTTHAEQISYVTTAIYNETLGFLLQAMAHHQLGEREQSVAWLQKAIGIMDRQFPQAGRDEIEIWRDWIHCQVLRREAESLIGGK